MVIIHVLIDKGLFGFSMFMSLSGHLSTWYKQYIGLHVLGAFFPFLHLELLGFRTPFKES